jgi:hypothetical protein
LVEKYAAEVPTKKYYEDNGEKIYEIDRPEKLERDFKKIVGQDYYKGRVKPFEYRDEMRTERQVWRYLNRIHKIEAKNPNPTKMRENLLVATLYAYCNYGIGPFSVEF